MAPKIMVAMVALLLAIGCQAKEREPENPLATRLECSSEDGHIWLYGDVDQVEVASPEACCALCENTPLCAKWSFGHEGKLLNKCLLRGPSAFSQKRNGFISGINSKYQPPKEVEEEVVQDVLA